MHQSLVTPTSTGRGNSGDFDFSQCNARVLSISQYCDDIFMVKALLKTLLKSRQVNVKLHWPYKSPSVPQRCWNGAEVKPWHLSSALVFPGPMTPDFMTPSEQIFKELNWLPFPKRAQYHTCLTVYNSISGQAPKYISSLPTNAWDHHER